MSILNYETSSTVNQVPIWDVGFSDTVNVSIAADGFTSVTIPENASHAIVVPSNGTVFVGPEVIVVPGIAPTTAKYKVPNDVVKLFDGLVKMTDLHIHSTVENDVTIQWLDLGVKYLNG